MSSTKIKSEKHHKKITIQPIIHPIQPIIQPIQPIIQPIMSGLGLTLGSGASSSSAIVKTEILPAGVYLIIFGGSCQLNSLSTIILSNSDGNLVGINSLLCFQGYYNLQGGGQYQLLSAGQLMITLTNEMIFETCQTYITALKLS